MTPQLCPQTIYRAHLMADAAKIRKRRVALNQIDQAQMRNTEGSAPKSTMIGSMLASMSETVGETRETIAARVFGLNFETARKHMAELNRRGHITCVGTVKEKGCMQAKKLWVRVAL